MISTKRPLAAAALMTCVLGPACLSRPLVSNEPTTKITFSQEQRVQAVDKIDLLLAIDNSSSMKDKQEFLAQAVPKLVARLVTPDCVETAPDGSKRTTGAAVTDELGEGTCPNGGRPEFKPITDIHVGIVSSSLGNFGATGSDAVCDTAHADDHAALLGRALGEDGNPVAIATEPQSFLAWFPEVTKNAAKPSPAAPYRELSKLNESFAALVRGVSDEGCGFEAQLESMYQFLIAPQPWERIALGADGRASYEGINRKVLQQRHDFLRPDSLVAVIMLTDEDDSSVDPLSVRGTGHYFMSRSFPQLASVGTSKIRPGSNGGATAARGTAICETNPGSPECTSCAFGGCPPESAYYDPEDDDLNVRFHDMKRRFGVDPQYPIARYARGLSVPTVPSRDAEHGGPGQLADYDETAADCVNPLFFGGELPKGDESAEDLCKLSSDASARDPNLVFFALVGGVPNELIGADRRTSTKELTADAWAALLGKNPALYEDGPGDGKDMRMVQSTAERPGRPVGTATAAPDPKNVDFPDYDTRKRDLQYACTFPLAKPIPANESIDCGGTPGDPRSSPLCAPGDPTTKRAQTHAKAYPTIREARLVHDLRGQGILGSLCPEVTTGDPAAPEYGYNPVVNEVVDRLRNSITSSCLPQPLERDSAGKVSC